jgi:gamma-glutamylcyclotransferase (GGCT)/AIG2-like uncharacterized protein YtfP
MPSRLCQLWSQEESRRSLSAALRGWNSAISEGWPGQLRAAGQVKQIFDRYDSGFPSAGHHSQHPASAETPLQALDRLLDFPSRRLAVYGSLAPGKKNHHVIAGINGSWRKATLRGSLRNEGWGAGEGFPGFLWDGTNTAVAAQVFSSSDLPHYWTMLDEFEGNEYRRILVPAEIDRIGKDATGKGGAGRDGAAIEICNVYALARSG